MAEFYSARGWEIPPLPWTNLSPPFSLLLASERVAGQGGIKSRFEGVEYENLAVLDRRISEVRARIVWFEAAKNGNTLPRMETW